MASDQAVLSASITSERDDRSLIFLHVPKTAGTALNRIIERQYNPLRIYSILGGHRLWSIEKFKRLPERRRQRLQVLKGHMGFGLHSYLPQPTTYMTMLRNPVDQVISSYYYALSHRFHPLHPIVTSQRMTLEDFLDITPWGHNLQTKLIGGLAMAEVQPPQVLAAAKRGERVCLEQFGGRHCDDDLFQASKRHLTHDFSVVGLTERFEESLALMMLEYGWSAPVYQHARRSHKRPANVELTPSARAWIERENVYDLDLYEFGQALFRSALERRRNEVQRALAQLRCAQPRSAWASRCSAAIAWGRFAVSLMRSVI